MSYAFDLNFRHCRNVGEAFCIAHKASETLWANLRSVIDDQIYRIPSLQYLNRKNDADLNRERDKYWLASMMHMDFIWWPEYKLLALLGSGWPKPILDMFKKRICFQNSCDQDYPFSDWKGLRNPFDGIVSDCANGDEETVRRYLNMGREEYPWEIEPDDTSSEENFAYYRRSAAYNGIYETLHLGQWLWGREDDSFMRFSITPLNSTERVYEAQNILCAYIKDKKSLDII